MKPDRRGEGRLYEDGSMNLNPIPDRIKRVLSGAVFKDAKAYDSFQFVRNGFF